MTMSLQVITISVYEEIVLEGLAASMGQSGPVVRFGPEGLEFAFNGLKSP